jgi:hypothetical protein
VPFGTVGLAIDGDDMARNNGVRARLVSPLVVTVLAVLLASCSDSGADLVEDLPFLNEGWSETPMAMNLCDSLVERSPRPDRDLCLRFAAHVDQQGCPIGAFLFGLMTLDVEDPLAVVSASGWDEIGLRYGCDVGFREFFAQTG